MNCKIVLGLQDRGIWHSWYSITLTPPFVPRVCQKWFGGLYMDWEDCTWIVRLYLDCKIAGFGTVGIVLPWPPPLCQKCAKKGWEDCIWIVSIVFGLCQLYWIVRVYLDCTNVFGLYDCIWIVQLYLDCTIAGFGTGGVVLPIPPPLCQKFVPKRIWSIVFGCCRLHLDCVDYMWIVLIVCGLILGQRPISRPPHPA